LGGGGVTCECERITQQHISRRMFGQLITYACDVAVYLVVYGADLECLFVDFVYSEASASHLRVTPPIHILEVVPWEVKR
jgi:hypothetical protein